ncbi:CHASE3 domain-containing protein [Kitasatospora paranensis]|uniref:CHASE3 domain-containing protein n=1 Tax=Kitasatospora paranensis TaxID=258053 RepID=UPI00361B0725
MARGRRGREAGRLTSGPADRRTREEIRDTGGADGGARGAGQNTVIRHHLEPAADAAEHLLTVVNAQSAAQRAHLLTGDPQYLTELDAGAGAAAETFAELNRQATAVAGLHLDLARLEHDLASWLAVLRAPVPAPAAPVPAAPTPASPVPSAAATAATTEAAAEAVRAADPAPLLAGTARIADGVAAEKQRLQAATSSDRTRMMVLVGALTAVLPALVGVLVVLGLRRLARPLADLERQVREAAHGDLTAPVVDGSARPGLLRGLFAELEGIRGLMTELRWDARRDQEALDQHGEAAVAVFEFLVAHSEPGPGGRRARVPGRRRGSGRRGLL